MTIDAALNGRDLSSGQLGIWLAQVLDTAGTAFIVGEYVEIRGMLDARLFEEALRRVVAGSDALSLRVVNTEGGPRQHLVTDLSWELTEVDCSSEADPLAAAQAGMHAVHARGFDPAREPLFRHALYRLAPDHFLWHTCYHHLC